MFRCCQRGRDRPRGHLSAVGPCPTVHGEAFAALLQSLRDRNVRFILSFTLTVALLFIRERSLYNVDNKSTVFARLPSILLVFITLKF